MGLFSGGFFGGGTDESRSSTVSTVNTTTNTTNKQKSGTLGVEGDQNRTTMVQGESVTLSMLDGDAIDRAFTESARAFDQANDTVAKALASISQGFTNYEQGLNEAYGGVYAANPINMNDVIKWGIVGSVIIFAILKGVK